MTNQDKNFHFSPQNLDIEIREYQQNIFLKTIKFNTLVVLPTGLGKTIIALLLAKYRLNQYPHEKILVLVPTRPLAEQHYRLFSKIAITTIFTGKIAPQKRNDLWARSQIIIATPQTVENDIINGLYDLKDVCLLVVDEAHRARGNYAYVFIAKEYIKQSTHPKILALTASPGNTKEEIKEIIDNLAIEHIEYRTEHSPDVRKYVHKKIIEFREVSLSNEIKQIIDLLRDCLKEIEVMLQKALPGFELTKKNLLLAEKHFRQLIADGDVEKFSFLTLVAKAMKIDHLITLIETQGIEQAYNFFKKLSSQDSTRASRELFNDARILKAYNELSILFSKQVEHPKYELVRMIVKEHIDKKMIIFTQYRETTEKIRSMIQDLVNTEIFVGQNKKQGTGMNQKQQLHILEKFRSGEIQVLISTSVAEEGLDIPEVDVVVFFEPIPSGIRQIQRKGRTGRHKLGKIIVLVTKGTRDEAYRWAAHHKEKRMYRLLSELKRDLEPKQLIISTNKTISLDKFMEDEQVKIFVDQREKNTTILRLLRSRNVELILTQLDVGDYLLSERCVVEYKTKVDFINSLIDGRIFKQLESLKSYEKPIILVEGQEDIYSIRKVYPNAIRGLISSIILDYDVPIIFTKSTEDTAEFLYMIAKREQRRIGNRFNPHPQKKQGDIYDEILYVTSALPGINTVIAQKLLKHFSTLKNIANSSVNSLAMVEKIGKTRAEKIYSVFNTPFLPKKTLEDFSKNETKQ